VLCAPQASERSSGVLSGLLRDRSRSAEPEGCDPTVFAEQIASYLERAAQDRADLLTDGLLDEVALCEDATAVDVPAAALLPVEAAPNNAGPVGEVATLPEETIAPPDDSIQEITARPDAIAGPVEQSAASSDEIAVSFDEITARLEEAAAPVDVEMPCVEPPAPAPVDESVWIAVEEAVRAQFWRVAPETEPLTAVPSPSTIEASEADNPTPPSAVDESIWIAVEEAVRAQLLTVPPAPPEPAVPIVRGEEWVELIESLRHDVERLRTERSRPAPKAPPSPRIPRSGRAARPTENEWGFFDPEQCGFAALLAKLEEVTESDETLRT
jgi:hypothetical protein